MNITLLTSWDLDGTAGSGVAVSIRGIRDGLAGLGERVRVSSGGRERGGYMRQSLGRIAWNRRLPASSLDGSDVVLGFDFDGSLLPRARPWPLVHVNGGTLADIVQFERGFVRLMLRGLARLEGRAARRADAVVVPSGYAGEAVRRHYGVEAGKIYVIPFGLHLRQWRQALAAAPPPAEPAPTILCVAKLYPRKGVLLLLDAFARVAAEVPAARLELVGGGLLWPEVVRRHREHPARDRIILHGDREPEALPGFYRRATVFCLPSSHETFGFVFLEAMAAGLPVVALRRAAVPELVRHGETGLLLDEATPEPLAGGLIRLLRDPAEAGRLGNGGRRRAADYTWEKTALALQDLCRRLIG